MVDMRSESRVCELACLSSVSDMITRVLLESHGVRRRFEAHSKWPHLKKLPLVVCSGTFQRSQQEARVAVIELSSPSQAPPIYSGIACAQRPCTLSSALHI